VILMLDSDQKDLITGLRKKLTVRETMVATGLSETTIQKYSKGKVMRRHDEVNRTLYDIVYDMLFAISQSKKGLRRTRIMYYANLSHDQLKKYLDILLLNGFIEDHEGFYQITNKGRSYMREYRILKGRLKRISTLLKKEDP